MPICQFLVHQITDSGYILPGLSLLSTSYLFATVNRKLHVLSHVSKYVNLHTRMTPLMDSMNGDSTMSLIIFAFINRIVYKDFSRSFEGLIDKDKPVTIQNENLQQLAIEIFKVKMGIL